MIDAAGAKSVARILFGGSARSMTKVLALCLTALLPQAASAEFFWNDPLPATVTGSSVTVDVGSVSTTIQDLNGNTIQTIAMVNSGAFPTQYKVDSRRTFREMAGGRYRITFSSPVDNPLVAIGSLGSGSIANRFNFEPGGGVTDVNIVFADAYDYAGPYYTAGGYETSAGVSNDTDLQNLNNVTWFRSHEGNIIARVNGTGITSITFNLAQVENYMTLLVGYDSVADSANSLLDAAPATVRADGSSSSTVTVTARDRFGNTFQRGGETVVISTDFGTVGAVTDNGDGTYTAPLTSASAGVAEVTATIGGNTITTPSGSGPVTATRTVTFEIETAPEVEISEDANNDGRISYAELDGAIDVTVLLPADVVAGDVVTVSDGTNVQSITLTAAQVSARAALTSFASPGDGNALTVTASIGNSASASDSATVVTGLFNDWAKPAEVCSGAYNHANFTGETGFFGVDVSVADGYLSSIYDGGYSGFTSPFADHAGRPAFQAAAPVSMGGAVGLGPAVDPYYVTGPDHGADAIVYSFLVPGRPGEVQTVQFGEDASRDGMLVNVEADDGSVLASQFISGAGSNPSHSGTLSYTVPGDGIAYLRYYVLDLAWGYGQVLDGGCLIDITAPVVTVPSGTVDGDLTRLSVDENQTGVVQISADEPVTWSLAGTDAALFQIDVDGVITFLTAPDYEAPGDADQDNVYDIEVTATDAAMNPSTLTVLVTVRDLRDTLPGDLSGPDGDTDGDGIDDGIESMTADRDGDGLVDAEDFDPQGYFYCEEDGRIMTGGSVVITGPAGSNGTAGTTQNNIRLEKDGSDGEFLWYATAPGSYSMAVTYPDGGKVSVNRLVSGGTLDMTSLLPDDPASLGSSEYGASGRLADYSETANSAFYFAFDIESGDPNLIGNNIPMMDCSPSEVFASPAGNGAEDNGGSVQPGGFVIRQTRISSEDSVVVYSIAGSAVADRDYTAVSGTATIPAGSTEVLVPVDVIEDTEVEGDETVVLELTALTAGDSAVSLAADAADRRASIVITDDDEAVIVVEDIDLTTAEGNPDDTGSMSFRLGSMPAARVVLTFAGDSQCEVGPRRMVFTRSSYRDPQVLTISGVDDEETEGAHGCRPTVTVASQDRLYDGYDLTLSRVTVLDDLVDQIRQQLTRILSDDLARTVETRSRRFSSIARGALSRLKHGTDPTACGEVEPFDVDGRLDAGVNGLQSDGTFGKTVQDCQAGRRRMTSGSFSINSGDGSGTQADLSFAVQTERMAGDHAVTGWFWGGYASRTDQIDAVGGNIAGLGLDLGTYEARKLSNGLLLDHYAALAVGAHRFDLDFGTAGGNVAASGDYRYAALFGGAALSGETRYRGVTLSPRFGIDAALASASDADVTARGLNETVAGRIEIPSFSFARGYAELGILFDELQGDENRSLEIIPRLACESSSRDDDPFCSYGGSVGYHLGVPQRGLELSFDCDYESGHDRSRSGCQVSRNRTFLNGFGHSATGLGVNHDGDATISQDINIRF